MAGKRTAQTIMSGILFLGMILSMPHVAAAQNHEPPGAAILAPADGALVANPVTITIGFSGRPEGPGGKDGDNADRPPPPPPGGERQEPPEHRQGPHGRLYLFVDAPTPEMGVPIHEDPAHVALAPRQRQLTLSLSPGPHRLQLFFADQDDKIQRPGQNAVTINVQ
jgi:hypothetical protein